jgi:GNAT superfamily N-acetyltransferase
MQIPTHSFRTWRLRFTVTDEPGRLAAAAAALGDLGVNILSLDFHVVSATEVIDEATVSLPPWLDVPAVEYALHGTGAIDVWAVPIPVHELEDIATRVLRLASSVIAASSDEQTLSDAIAQLVDAELVSTRRIDLDLDGAGESGTPAAGLVRFGRSHVKRLPSHAGSWTMEIPDDPFTPHRVFVAIRRSSPFTSTEAARATALVQVAAATDALPTGAGGLMPADVRISRLTSADLDEVEELHRQCSPESRYRRYFSAMPIIRRDVIAGLLEARHGRTALGAWTGDRLVGMGNACATDAGGPDRCVELALLVEDDRQGQGIGTRLAQELVGAASRSGAKDFLVLTLPDNQAMERIVRGMADVLRTDRAHDTVTFRFTVPDPVAPTADLDIIRG